MIVDCKLLDAQDPTHEIGRRLRDAVNNAVLPVMTTNQNKKFMRAGVGKDSCTAAVLVAEPTGSPVGIEGANALCSTSQLFRGLAPLPDTFVTMPCMTCGRSDLGQHAEQMAIRIAETSHYTFKLVGGCCHVYVDFSPCPGCEPWLRNRAENWVVWYSAHYTNQRARNLYARQRVQDADTMQRFFKPHPDLPDWA